MMDRIKNLIIKPIRVLFLVMIFLGMTTLNGCYYDDEDNLYPQLDGCDTSNVTYSETISGIMNSNCNACHSGPAANANVITDNYDDLKIIADNGRLWGVVNHESGYSPMPKDRPKLSECDLSKIRIWLDNGALND